MTATGTVPTTEGTVDRPQPIVLFDGPAGLLLEEALDPAAATGPVLHARVLAMLAEQDGRTPARMEQAAAPHYGEAVARLEGTGFEKLAAHLRLERGVPLHQLAEGPRHNNRVMLWGDVR